MSMMKRLFSSGIGSNKDAGVVTSRTSRTVLVFEGDGIGPEIVRAARRVVEGAEAKRPVSWLEQSAGAGLRGLQSEHLELFDRHRLIFKGPLTIVAGATDQNVEIRGRRFTSGNQVFRKLFNLYANIRPARSFGANNAPHRIDWLVVRENTEDVYTGEERLIRPTGGCHDDEFVEAVKRNSRRASALVAQRAARLALESNRRRITILHKANVCKLGDGLWLREATAAAHATLGDAAARIKVDDSLADSFFFKAVINPNQYDVLLCPNLIGDFASDFAAGFIGSLGLCASANLGTDYALFEPAHGSAPDIAGRQLANPISMILSGALMLREMDELDAAARIERAVERAVAAGDVTPDLGGKRTTNECAQAIIDQMK
jgi:isocitrate dehydrogenase (NAD+)